MKAKQSAVANNLTKKKATTFRNCESNRGHEKRKSKTKSGGCDECVRVSTPWNLQGAEVSHEQMAPPADKFSKPLFKVFRRKSG